MNGKSSRETRQRKTQTKARAKQTSRYAKSRRTRIAQAAPHWWPITPIKIRKVANKIAATAHPEKIILFGSFAYGKPNIDSDVDLLVIIESQENIYQRSAQISDILHPRPFPVDIIVRTSAEIAERLAAGDEFYHRVTTRGKILYERQPH